MNDSTIVHMLWIGKQISAMEKMTLQSFIKNGFTVYLWCYDSTLCVPETVLKKDANEVIPEEDIFSYKYENKFGHGKGSLSGFSDIFRYKLLYEWGGIWVDMDITCLTPFEINEPYFFRYHHQIGLVGNVIKTPKHSPLMNFCYEKSIQFVHLENKNWLLPIEILKEGVYKYNLQHYIQDISNKDSFPIVKELLLNNKTNFDDWKIIHWMNEELRRLDINKEIAVKGSAYQYLLGKYNIQHRIANKDETIAIRWKTSAIHYTWLNINARLNWYKNNLIDYFQK